MLRLAWALRVTWALDAARAAEAAAGVVASRDIKAAAELLTQAERLRDTGRADDAGSLTSRDESIAAWDAHHGGSMNDPAVREKVYKAVAALRQKEIEQAEAAAVSQAKAVAKNPRRRRRM